MKAAPLGPGPFPALHKGGLGPILLRTLSDRPMHGYEIMGVLEERWHGMWRPSPGAVYPALRGLLRRGLVAVSGEERRKTYRITAAGRAVLRRQKREFERRFREFESSVGPERAALVRELRTTGKLLGANMRNLTPAQARELAGEVARLRQKLMKILSR